MSASASVSAALPPTPQSTKKRKNKTETPEHSKKKRKHDVAENSVLTSQESTASKKDKKKRKDRTQPLTFEQPDTQETVDVVLADAPAENGSPIQEQNEDDGLMNGTHLSNGESQVEEIDETLMQSNEPSCFYEKRLSLQVPIPSITLASPTSSLLSLHLAPLLLTYFAPAEGIVLSFTDPILSARPSKGVNLPLKPPKSGEIPRYPPDETFTRCADAYGVCWVWLTATFMVFRPETGDKLKGWTNVTSEGFVGLISYNYFQSAVGKVRIPKKWVWDGPTRESHARTKKARKGKLRDENGVTESQEDNTMNQDTIQNDDMTGSGTGSFMGGDGNAIPATQIFKVVDVEMVPGHEKEKWTLQIDGSLLPEDEEAEILAEERSRFEQAQQRGRSRSKTPGMAADAIPLVGGSSLSNLGPGSSSH